ncbi:MAG: NADH-quinone oxidoreductase subunit J [Acidobacteria bacterium]|jgi:NADH-quinone oxidoreductase subunit J|nr:MAG: NADH-quinone oxidoreductase subunit J [Acidobacteriota bacterium]GIU81440.1 MAG: NADH dehydrogenase subunit J [Pyrinomonadaceae bacterium]
MITTLLFFLFAGFAIACAGLMVYHKNPLYSAISLIGVFIALACIYMLLAAPFIAAVQVLVYAGAIMVLVIFVIMLLNLEEDKPLTRLRHLYLIGSILGLVLLAQTLFIFYAVKKSPQSAQEQADAGLTLNIGRAMFTEYLLPVEIAGVLLLMAIVGAMVLSRRLKETRLDIAQKEKRR